MKGRAYIYRPGHPLEVTDLAKPPSAGGATSMSAAAAAMSITTSTT